LTAVHGHLAFGLPLSQGGRPLQRDPSADPFRFERLRWGDPFRYAVSNVSAAWLLGLLADVGPFESLPEHRRLLALQSALFVIGYDVSCAAV
jgi:hypothetical protein